jgi:two-component system chemotaxis response regulator CheB
VTAPHRVLVVDDSAVVRQTLSAVLSPDEGFLVQVAPDPLIAMDKMRKARPDVIVLDLELPRMDGLTFLRRLMAEERPVPVVVCSGLAGGAGAMRALEEGAVAVIEKPRLDVRGFLFESAVRLIDTVRGAAQARLLPRPAAPPPLQPETEAPRPATTAVPQVTDVKVVAVGASTGGTEALLRLLAPLPPDSPPILVVQHMPAGFTRAFAERLDQSCRIQVREARHGDAVHPGLALVAPGNRHLILRRRGAGHAVHLSDGPLVSRHRPSVDVLFRSVAQAAGRHALGVILTGMGDDGARGLLEMKAAGAFTLAQDEASCVVFGMPREAIARHAVTEVVPLDRLAAALVGRATRA